MASVNLTFIHSTSLLHSPSCQAFISLRNSLSLSQLINSFIHSSLNILSPFIHFTLSIFHLHLPFPMNSVSHILLSFLLLRFLPMDQDYIACPSNPFLSFVSLCFALINSKWLTDRNSPYFIPLYPSVSSSLIYYFQCVALVLLYPEVFCILYSDVFFFFPLHLFLFLWFPLLYVLDFQHDGI